MGFYKVCVLLSDAQLKETNNILAGLNISHVRTRDCFILHTEEGECKSVNVSQFRCKFPQRMNINLGKGG